MEEFLFNEYLTESERSELLEIATLENKIDKAFATFDMLLIQEAQMEKDIKLKVFTEGGSFDDYSYLLTEAEEETKENKKGILVTIAEGISSLLNKLFSGIAKLFKKKDPEAKIEDPDGTINKACQWIDNAKGGIEKIGDDLKNKKFGEAFDEVKKLAKPELAVGVAGAAITVGTLQSKFDLLSKAKNKIDEFCKTAKEWLKTAGDTLADTKIGGVVKKGVEAAQEALKTVSGFISSHIQPVLDKIGAAIGKAPDKAENANTNTSEEDPTDPDKTASQQPNGQAPTEGQSDSGFKLANQNRMKITNAPNENYEKPNMRTFYADQNSNDNNRYVIRTDGGLEAILDSNGNPLPPGQVTIPQAISNAQEKIKNATGNNDAEKWRNAIPGGIIESADDVFDINSLLSVLGEGFTVEAAEDGESVIITDHNSYEISTEQSIYGESVSTDVTESFDDLFSLL